MATVYEFNYTGSEQSITLKPGKYKLECWGASGGEMHSASSHSSGGYSVGELILRKKTLLYIYVGQLGLDVSSSVYAFNGGGYGTGAVGGGATDIRLVGGAWDNEQGLFSRIIVAGGGGGWFGGSGCHFSHCNGGGGSGYVLTKDSYKPIGYTPASEYWLENASTTVGKTLAGHDGINGRAKITLLQTLPFLTVSSYNSTQAIFKADHTDPTLLTKIEIFIDDVLKEAITTDLTLEKTINYTLEDNALHTLKIVVTDNANATAEKIVSISNNIMPLEDDASLQDIISKIKEMKDGLKSGKRSIVNVLELKDIDANLNNTFVELSEKVKDYFDSADSFFQEANKGKELIANAIGLPATKENTFSELATYINENKAKIVDVLVKKQQLVTNEDSWEIITNIIKELYSVTYSYSTSSIIRQESFTSQIANSTYPPGGGGSVSNYTYWLGYTFLNNASKIKVHIDCHKDNTSGSGYNEIRINFKHTSNGKVINSFTCDQFNPIDKEIMDIKKGDYFYFEYYVGGVIGKTYSCGANAKIYGVINYIK
ncbi:TPA: hypothetical protein STY81_002963 [Clostridioides difficile]|nr:hypothetical protein [Clostridioides difficile]